MGDARALKEGCKLRSPFCLRMWNRQAVQKARILCLRYSLHTQLRPKEFTLTADMVSLKKVYAEGNVQWTMARVQNEAGTKSTFLDCDMDEHYNVIDHTTDLFKHLFRGGTHPIDIHEYIVSAQKALNLGYGLVSKAPVALVVAA